MRVYGLWRQRFQEVLVAEEFVGNIPSVPRFPGFRTPFGSMSGFVAGSIEGVAEGVLAPVAAAATVGQLTVHAGCAISAAF
jgi:hypothetical protein